MLARSKMLRKGLLGTAAVALIGAAGLMTAPKDANATAFAYSAIEVTNLQMSGLTNGFSSFSFSSAGLAVNLNGTVANQSAVGPVLGQGSVILLDQICVGSCGSFQNDVYIGAPAQPVPGGQGSFAVADMNMSNTVIAAGNPNGPGAFGGQAGAQASSGAGGVSSASNNSMAWNFTLDADSDVSVTWDHLIELHVATTNGGEQANAAASYVVEIFNAGGVVATTTVIDFEDDDLNITSLSEDGTEITTSLAETDSLDASLNANVNYQLVITFDNFAQVSSLDVPEPGTLGLLGVGLLGLGFAGYRRRKLG